MQKLKMNWDGTKLEMFKIKIVKKLLL